MRFHTLDLALTAQRAIVPLVQRIQRHDRKLAQQMKDATNSFVLNLGDAICSHCTSRNGDVDNLVQKTLLFSPRGGIYVDPYSAASSAVGVGVRDLSGLDPVEDRLLAHAKLGGGVIDR
jgi:hypothetical protein